MWYKKKISFSIIKEVLTFWIEKVLQVDLIISNSILSNKTLKFTFLYKKDKFKWSYEWINNFKKRHSLRQYNIYGKEISMSFRDLKMMHENIYEILKNYDIKDIFNCNKINLFLENAT